MALAQRRPDPLKEEALLRRVFPAEQVNKVVFYEQAVRVQGQNDKLSYELYVVTQDAFYHIDPDSVTPSELKGIPLDEIDLIEQLPDIATFFDADLARHTRHYRVHTSNQLVGVETVLDFFTYFEDSSLGYFLTQAWLHAKVRRSLSSLYVPLPQAGSPLSLLPSNNAAGLLFNTLKQQYLSHAAGFEPQLSSLPPALANATVPGFVSMAPEAVESRVRHVVAKIKVLEEIAVCLASPRALMFQRLIMTQTDINTRLFMDIALAGPLVSLYTRAAANQYRAGAPQTDVADALKALGEAPTEKELVSSTTGAPLSTTMTATTATAAVPSSTSGAVVNDAEFQGEREVFDAREGHFAEELMRVELALTTLTVINLTLQGSHALGARRLNFLHVSDNRKLMSILNACTFTNVDLYQPAGAGRELLEIARRRKLQRARQAHEQRFRQQQLDAAILQDQAAAQALSYQKSLGLTAGAASSPQPQDTPAIGEAQAAVRYRHQVDDATVQSTFEKLKLRLFELDNQVAWFLYLLFDLCDQSKSMRDSDVRLSADWLTKSLLAIPRFSSDRIPSMIRRLNAMIQQQQSPVLGVFIYVTVDVINRILARSMAVRYSVSKICRDIFVYDLGRREVLDQLRTSSDFFYRAAAPRLLTLLEYIRSASEGFE